MAAEPSWAPRRSCGPKIIRLLKCAEMQPTAASQRPVFARTLQGHATNYQEEQRLPIHCYAHGRECFAAIANWCKGRTQRGALQGHAGASTTASDIAAMCIVPQLLYLPVMTITQVQAGTGSDSQSRFKVQHAAVARRCSSAAAVGSAQQQELALAVCEHSAHCPRCEPGKLHGHERGSGPCAQGSADGKGRQLAQAARDCLRAFRVARLAGSSPCEPSGCSSQARDARSAATGRCTLASCRAPGRTPRACARTAAPHLEGSTGGHQALNNQPGVPQRHAHQAPHTQLVAGVSPAMAASASQPWSMPRMCRTKPGRTSQDLLREMGAPAATLLTRPAAARRNDRWLQKVWGWRAVSAAGVVSGLWAG